MPPLVVDAIYENGVLKLKEALALPEGAKVRVSVSPNGTEARGARLIREAEEHHADVIAAWGKFMANLGSHGEQIDIKKLRERIIAEGINPDDNSFSREIIAMREE